MKKVSDAQHKALLEFVSYPFGKQGSALIGNKIRYEKINAGASGRSSLNVARALVERGLCEWEDKSPYLPHCGPLLLTEAGFRYLELALSGTRFKRLDDWAHPKKAQS